jgi:hypothetical protein
MKQLALVSLLVCFVLSASGCCGGKVRISAYADNDSIRSRILAHTPIGSDPTNVLNFVVSRLCSQNVSIRGDSSYIDGIPVAGLRRVRRAMQDGKMERCIEVVRYPAGLTAKQITVTWMFGTNNTLTSIIVDQRIWSL